MKNDFIKSAYALTGEQENSELLESPERRDFLKKAGLAGLALAGVGGTTGLNGCAALGRDFTKYDFKAVARRYENNPIQINSLDDFALSGEEMGTMRLCELWEKETIPIISQNPWKGRSSLYSIGGARAPPCEEWLLAEYTGRTNFPHYRLSILANKFKSEQDCLETQEILKEWHKTKNFHYKFRTFSKENFIVNFATNAFIDESQKQEHIARANLYQKKRGLNLFVENF